MKDLNLPIEYGVQWENACLSAAVLTHLGVPLDGMSSFYWPCRMESFHLQRNRIIVLDGCHNDNRCMGFNNVIKITFVFVVYLNFLRDFSSIFRSERFCLSSAQERIKMFNLCSRKLCCGLTLCCSFGPSTLAQFLRVFYWTCLNRRKRETKLFRTSTNLSAKKLLSL